MLKIDVFYDIIQLHKQVIEKIRILEIEHLNLFDEMRKISSKDFLKK